MSDMNVFDPTLYSKQECEFLLENLGKPPVVAMRELKFPVNPKAVQPILQRVHELQQLEEHEGTRWVGLEPLKNALVAYLRENAKWKADWQRTRGRAPRFPSLYSFDGRGRAHRGGVGSDSGKVRSYFDAEGNRIPFAIQMTDIFIDDWTPPGFTEKPDSKSYLKVDNDLNRIECLICGKAESFKAESRSSYSAARARMSKHMRRAETKKEEHLEAYTNEFGA